jgi:hypothetical protein
MEIEDLTVSVTFDESLLVKIINGETVKQLLFHWEGQIDMFWKEKITRVS